MKEKTKVTKEYLQQLEEERRVLIDVTREEVKKQLAEARAQGDLSENADYDAARNKQAIVEARIQEIENILNNHEIIDSKVKNLSKVNLGSYVTITYLDSNKSAKYKIVGTVESDPFKGKISNDSPLGMALIDKHKGDIVEVKAKINYNIRIDEISNN